MFEKIKNIFKTKEKIKKKKTRTVANVNENNEYQLNIQQGKKLFWGKYPHYPEMGSVYRKLFQKLRIVNNRVIKVYQPSCGTDMCNIATGISSIFIISLITQRTGLNF